MKKIGILTYHRVYNFGSLLQTYALQEYLKKKECEVEVIDYYPKRLRMRNTLFHVNPSWSQPITKRIVHLVPAVVARALGYLMMNTFLHKYVNLSKRSYLDEEELKKDLPEENVYLNGSDQVWNLDTADGVIDKVFFMEFIPESKNKAAYAGSFGKDCFSEDQLKEIGYFLKQYKIVSVRERTGLDILQKAGIEGGKWVLDPSFLLNKSEWMQIAKKVQIPEHYLLVYNLNRNPRINNLAVKIAKEKKLQIVNFAHSFCFIPGAKNVLYPTPNSFLYLFANADYVVTDSFHGTAFSINFNRQFICVPAPRFNSRLRSVLGLVGLEDRLLNDEDDFEIINRMIDYTKINYIIEKERNMSDEIINDILALA